MEVQKVKEKILHKAISGAIFAAIFSVAPIILNFTLHSIQDFRLRTAPMETFIQVNEFSVVPTGDDLLEYTAVWDRCVARYLPVQKNFEVIQVGNNGQSYILAKSESENIDFNEGCSRLELPLGGEDWLFVNEPVEEAEGYLLMQLIVEVGPYSRPFLVTSEPFEVVH